MPRPKRLQVLPIRIDDAMREELGEMAEREHRSISNLIYMILDQWLDQNSPRRRQQGEN